MPQLSARALARAAHRTIQQLTAEGEPLSRALQAAGVGKDEYLQWRARYGGMSVARVRDMYAQPDAGAHADDYIGRSVEGVCPVCGEDRGFAAFSDNVRESGACVACGSSNRQRQMAYMLRSALNIGLREALVLPYGVTVHNTESTGALHARLIDQPGYTFSEYWGPEYGPGEEVQGIRNEDLQALSFPDGSLDIMLSSDVLEHMPSPYQAHAEIFRVLKPRGRHIFTAPFGPVPHDDVRATIVDGEVVHLAEPVFHGDPIRPDTGVLVWTVFGMEMFDRLEEIGFRPLLWGLCKPELGIVGQAPVFEVYKPGPAYLAALAWIKALAGPALGKLRRSRPPAEQ